ncbi:MAG: cysteine dioxygenase family protein [Planctomycetota bacterium]|jgi:predicted metal-dependent enzyme (double-stranded beta helix superfamily)
MEANGQKGALGSLIDDLDRAVDAGEAADCCREVKSALVRAVAREGRLVEPRLLTPTPDCYARRLLHRDAAGRYSVVLMVWGPGQSTPIHDHAGKWCVECVYLGRIRVTSYRIASRDEDRFRFETEDEIAAGLGDAGALIPPFEYHRIENPHREVAATIHVYRGEMTSCHTFAENGDGSHRRVVKELVYTP